MVAFLVQKLSLSRVFMGLRVYWSHRLTSKTLILWKLQHHIRRQWFWRLSTSSWQEVRSIPLQRHQRKLHLIIIAIMSAEAIVLIPIVAAIIMIPIATAIKKMVTIAAGNEAALEQAQWLLFSLLMMMLVASENR
jgi:hypothetical protein